MNGWIRLGIVASIIWAFVGGFWANLVIVRYENNIINLNHTVCRSQKEVDVSRGIAGAADRDCWAMAYNDPDNAKVRRSRWEIPILALGPLPFAWLIGWLVFATIRWVGAGFRTKRKGDTA